MKGSLGGGEKEEMREKEARAQTRAKKWKKRDSRTVDGEGGLAPGKMVVGRRRK